MLESGHNNVPIRNMIAFTSTALVRQSELGVTKVSHHEAGLRVELLFTSLPRPPRGKWNRNQLTGRSHTPRESRSPSLLHVRVLRYSLEVALSVASLVSMLLIRWLRPSPRGKHKLSRGCRQQPF